jgi:TctA family transporter
MEENLCRALLMARGNAEVFVTQPISLGFLLASSALLATLILPKVRRTRDEALQE